MEQWLKEGTWTKKVDGYVPYVCNPLGFFKLLTHLHKGKSKACLSFNQAWIQKYNMEESVLYYIKQYAMMT